MLGFIALTPPPTPRLPSIPFPLLQTHLNFSSYSPLKTQIPKTPKRFVVFADDGNGRGRHTWFIRSDSGGGDDHLGKNQRPSFENIRWGDLLLDPDPNNILAVGLTGLLTWASVQVLWQLLFIALDILVAAVKYSFIAALLLFILITLL
ncbi:hypothetical protein D8674_020700 [Pyrus ussuriensis x Pyrus communis]|uniref:Uncharacterized protein n=1 Tax=Pyrus ussuriensis x Pyrus communis TaxID=2448454 RepID=A0A5N5HLQ2_9ROSA|nr:hypothetical protein D8674_020700 [Pyrus ussuriensis x Pyrus communis]